MKHATLTRLLATASASLLALFALAARAEQHVAQRSEFYNLTAHQVQVDSVLPVFEHVFALPDDYQDSTYQVKVVYPEFIDMHQGDIARLKAMGVDTMPPLPEIRTYVGVDRKKASLYTQLCPVVFRDGRWQKLVSFRLNLTSDANGAGSMARQMAGAPRRASASETYASHSKLSTGRWVKISVSNTGIHQLTGQFLNQCGFADASKVKVYGYGGALQPEKITNAYLQANDDLSELPTCYTNDGRRLFYAYGPVNWTSNTVATRTRNPYSTHGYYFLTEDGEAPTTITQDEFYSRYGVMPANYHSLYEVDDYSWFHGGRNLYGSTPLSSNANGLSYTLQANGGSGRLSVALSFDGQFQVQILLNGQLINTVKPSNSIVSQTTGKLVDSYSKAAVSTWTTSVSNLNVGDNTVTVKQVSGSGTVRTDYVQLVLQTPKPTGDFNSTSWPEPAYAQDIYNQDRHADPQADMVIIIPTSQQLAQQANRLADWHRQKDGMSVNVVPANELYNEFSSGTPDANAYRRYMKMLYDRAGSDESQMPKYLLLFGDAAWDNRMLGSDWQNTSPDDFLLCYESENSFSEVKCYISDDFFVMLDEGEGASLVSSDKADVAVGRLTARTATEAKILVDKICSYTSNETAGVWQNSVCMMGDDGNSNLHMNDAEVVSAMLMEEHPDLNLKKVYWDAYQRQTSATGKSYPDVTRLIKQQMQNGALVMNYTGHGAPYCLSHEMVVKLADFSESTSLRLPLWFTASCDVMPFDGQEENIGETAMLNPNGGAIAFYGTTRTVYAAYNRLMNKYFMHHLLSSDAQGRRVSIGEAVRRAKNQLLTRVYDEKGLEIQGVTDFTENKLQYSLLGDPAVVLALPTTKITIDSINGHSTDAVTKLSAGTLITVQGHVNDRPDFKGTATITVRDVEEEVRGRCNDPIETPTAIVFNDRPSTLFEGSDSVYNGKFSITFRLPRDISYSASTGLITAYAASNDRQQTAHGHNESFSFDGTDVADNSGKGPIVYCYLNKPSFSNGDVVNQTPYFYAEISDEDGINTAGSGIGHDLQLTIDGQLATTYNLNNYFQFDFGNYRSGHVGFSIPTLEEGQHHLLFRAWDVLNNPTTSELTFTVQSGLSPTDIDVVSTRNPAKTSTTFLITHDRIGSQLTVVMDVFDTSGRQLWMHSEECVPTSNTYTVDWNLCASQGYRLPPGLYIYRVRLSSEGSDVVSKSRKLVIVK